MAKGDKPLICGAAGDEGGAYMGFSTRDRLTRWRIVCADSARA